jgi:phosphohistidine phosphatase
MELYVLRHAIAVERGTPGYERDSERPLTTKGARKMHNIAEGMQALGLEFDLILSSPYTRARETAEIVAGVFDLGKKLHFTDHLAIDGDPRLLVDEINREHEHAGSIVLVGHEPYLSGFISTLLSGDDHLSITMKKGGLCKLYVDSLQYGRCATLEWLMTPRQMTGLG